LLSKADANRRIWGINCDTGDSGVHKETPAAYREGKRCKGGKRTDDAEFLLLK
jgi:hypothetical protein